MINDSNGQSKHSSFLLGAVLLGCKIWGRFVVYQNLVFCVEGNRCRNSKANLLAYANNWKQSLPPKSLLLTVLWLTTRIKSKSPNMLQASSNSNRTQRRWNLN
jgi:hypothetical protein